MRQILTSDQFVAGIIAVLALQDRKHFVLTETELDKRFEDAFEDLVAHEDDFQVTPNFTFYVDGIHRDSVCLRDTLLTARDRELITFNNPTFRTFDIKLTDRRAEKYLERSPLPKDFFLQLVEKHFSDLA